MKFKYSITNTIMKVNCERETTIPSDERPNGSMIQVNQQI